MTREARTWTTYHRKDGEPIDGMYGWVSDLEFFDDTYTQYDPIELVKEVWVLQSREEITYPAPCEHVWEDDECVECGAEREAAGVSTRTTENPES